MARPRPRGRRSIALATAACAGLSGGAGAARAQGAPGGGADLDTPLLVAPSVLQPTGFGPATPPGGLDSARLQPATQPNWTLTPALTLAEEYVAGSYGAAGGGAGSGAANQFITTLQPRLAASADTARLHGDLFYSPALLVYSRDSSQDQVAQNFNGRALLTVLPQTLFIDLRGAASEQPITAGQPPLGATSLPRSALAQVYTASVTPYAVHRFADLGTLEIGAVFSTSSQSALSSSTTAATPTLTALGTPLGTPFGTPLGTTANQNLVQTGGHAAFVTGEAFARYNGALQAQATSTAGGGVLQGARRDSASLDNGYAITRNVIALGAFGWEDIHYGGLTPLRIDDATWNVGARFLPNADSSIVIRYGHQDGVNAASVKAAYQATARIRLYASYSRGLTTSAEQFQNALATSDLDALGNPVDHTTGAPLLPTGSFFGLNSNLYDTTLATFTAVWQLARDSVSASVNRQDQTLVSASNELGVLSGNSRGLFGLVSWSHELRPGLRATTFLQYGTSHGSGALPVDERLLTASATLSYALSEKLTGNLQAIYTQSSGENGLLAGTAGLAGTQGIFLLSLTRTF